MSRFKGLTLPPFVHDRGRYDLTALDATPPASVPPVDLAHSPQWQPLIAQ